LTQREVLINEGSVLCDRVLSDANGSGEFEHQVPQLFVKVSVVAGAKKFGLEIFADGTLYLNNGLDCLVLRWGL